MGSLDCGLWTVDVSHQMLIADMIKEKESLFEASQGSTSPDDHHLTVVTVFTFTLLKVIRRLDIKINYNILTDLGITCYPGFITTYHINMITLFTKQIFGPTPAPGIIYIRQNSWALCLTIGADRFPSSQFTWADCQTLSTDYQWQTYGD